MVVRPMLASGAGQFEQPYVEYGSSRHLSAMQSSAELDRALGLDPNDVGYAHGIEVAGEAALRSLPPVAVASGVYTMADAESSGRFAGGALEAALGAVPMASWARAELATLRTARAAPQAMQKTTPFIVVESPATSISARVEAVARTTSSSSGPVRLRPPPNATPEEIAQARAYCQGCNNALARGELSSIGRVSTKGALREQASRAADRERARAQAAGQPYQGHAGHVPDTTWTGNAVPPGWADLSPRVNTSLGGQAGHYPVGYKPTIFELVEDLERLQ